MKFEGGKDDFALMMFIILSAWIAFRLATPNTSVAVLFTNSFS